MATRVWDDIDRQAAKEGNALRRAFRSKGKPSEHEDRLEKLLKEKKAA